MKIAFYAPSKEQPDIYELQEFDLRQSDFASILHDVQTHAQKVDQSAPQNDTKCIIMNGQQFEFANEHDEFLVALKDRLLRGKFEDAREEHAVKLENAFEDEAAPEPRPASRRMRAAEQRSNLSTLITIRDQFITPWLDKFTPYIEADRVQFAEKAKIYNQYPETLESCDAEALNIAISSMNTHFDELPILLDEENSEDYLREEIANLENHQQAVTQLLNIINQSKINQMQLQSYASRLAFIKQLSPIEIEKLNHQYAALRKLLTALKVKIEEIKSKAAQKLADIEEKKYANSIVIRTWYASKSDDEEREIMGIPSDGHTTVELYKNRNERIYLGFYVLPKRDKSTKAQIFRKFGLPSPDAANGYFVDLEHDLSLFGEGKKFSRCKTVSIKCDREGAELNFDSAYAWAVSVKRKYPIIRGPLGRSIQVINDYSFYNNNCATLGANVLEHAGANKHLKYRGKTVANFDTPTGVFSYAQRVEEHLADKHALTLEKMRLSGEQKTPRKKKYIKYFGTAIEKLKLLKISIQSKGQIQSGNSTIDVIDELITCLLSEAEKINSLEEGEINNFLVSCTSSLREFLTERFPHLTEGRDELAAIIKKLTNLLAGDEFTLIKAMQMIINFSLSVQKDLKIQKVLGDFEPAFDKIYDIVNHLVTFDPKNLFDFELQLRIGLAKLNKIRLQVSEQYKRLCKESKKNPEELKRYFKHLADYYNAVYKQLRETVGELHNEIYFNNVFDARADANSALNLIHTVLLPRAEIPSQKSLGSILKSAKISWDQVNPALDKINDQDQLNILRKQMHPDHGIAAPNKPHVLAFWNKDKRHQHFELENMAKVYKIVNSDKFAWQTQLHKINKRVENNKPSAWKFWRRAERKRYEDMGARASLICLMQAFAQGEISETELVFNIKKIIPSIDKSSRQTLEQFSNTIMQAYKSNVANQGDSAKSTHACMMRKLLKNAMADCGSGSFLDDLSMFAYTASQLQRLPAKAKQPAQAAQPAHAPNPISAEEQVEMERSLHKQLAYR